MKNLLEKLFPINRSLTGDGNRETLRQIQEIIPLEIKEIPSGKEVYDWKIPPEWTIRDAWIKNSSGEKIIDFKKSNLHVVQYSEAVHQTIKFENLKKNLHFLENLPNAIPYRTTYYQKKWGFCLTFNDFQNFFEENEKYEVFIDSDFNENGSLSYGELLISGEKKEEILISTYICHPSLANDNLSGIVLTTFLAKWLLSKKNYYSYRIIFVPETIGTIAYLHENQKKMQKINFGCVVTTVGGQGKFGFKKSFDENHFINFLAEKSLENFDKKYISYPFDIFGSDERQYSSVGFRINTISITKDKYYEYPFYHTSLDNLDFVKAENIEKTLDVYKKWISLVEMNRIYKNKIAFGEVMLSKHDLYPKNGGAFLPESHLTELDLIQWILFYSDGKTDLVEISKKIDAKLEDLFFVAEKLKGKNVLMEI
jgi:aminopeptidase-like protein